MNDFSREDRSIESFEELFAELKQYLKLQKEFVFIKLTSKLAVAFSMLVLVTVLLILGVAAVFYFLFALAYALQPCMGLPLSFCLIGGIAVLLIVLILIFRKKWIIRPTVNFLAHLLLDDEEEEKDDEDE
jgi:O-antigen ligase